VICVEKNEREVRRVRGSRAVIRRKKEKVKKPFGRDKWHY